MKLTNKQQKTEWINNASEGFGARIWGNPFRPNIRYKFNGFSDKTETKTIKRKGESVEITERFIFVKNLDTNKESEVNAKYFFTTYNESEDLNSSTVYALGNGDEDPVQILFNAVDGSKEFKIEYFEAYSLDFAHWQKHQERQLKLNQKAIKYIIA